MKPVRVLHLITDSDSGGAQVMLRNITTHMRRDWIDNVVVSMMEPGSLAPSFGAGKIPLHSLGMRRGIPDPRALWALIRIVRRVRPDVLLTWMYAADLLGTAVAKLIVVPLLVWNVRNAEIDETVGRATRVSLALLTRLSRAPAAVITNSAHARKVHEQLGYRPRVWELLPNGFDVDRFRADPVLRALARAQLGVPDDALLVGLMARFHPVKDHRMFLDAVRIASRPGVHYLFAGRGTEQIGEMARELAPGQPIHALGERYDMPELTAALDIACLSSAPGESFPNSLGEAMASAVPCLTTSSGDAAWLVGDAGRVVPPRDAAAFGAALAELIDAPPQVRIEMGARGRLRIERDFSLPAVAAQYENFLMGMVAASRG